MDSTDLKILDLLERNARISFQELGDAVGMSRVAARKRVQKLEREGVIRGYTACVCREDEITMLIDVVTVPGRFDEVLQELCRAPYIRQIFRTTMENHIHMVAVSDRVSDLRTLTDRIRETCGSNISELHCHAVKETVRNAFGGNGYGAESGTDGKGDYEQA